PRSTSVRTLMGFYVEVSGFEPRPLPCDGQRGRFRDLPIRAKSASEQRFYCSVLSSIDRCPPLFHGQMTVKFDSGSQANRGCRRLEPAATGDRDGRTIASWRLSALLSITGSWAVSHASAGRGSRSPPSSA